MNLNFIDSNTSVLFDDEDHRDDHVQTFFVNLNIKQVLAQDYTQRLIEGNIYRQQLSGSDAGDGGWGRGVQRNYIPKLYTPLLVLKKVYLMRKLK